MRTTCIHVRRFHLLHTQSRKWKKSVISEFKDWCLWCERGSEAAAVCLHHLLSVQLAAESFINTPSRGESPVIPLVLPRRRGPLGCGNSFKATPAPVSY